MSNEVFRKKSIERINSPEDLNEYIRVSNPGIWLLLIGIIVLLFGAVVWGYVGSLETWEDATIIAENGQVTCVLRPEIQDKLASGMQVVIEDYDIKTQIVKVISNTVDSTIALPNQDTFGQNASNQDTSGQNASNQDTSGQNASNQDASNQNASGPNTASRDAFEQYASGGVTVTLDRNIADGIYVGKILMEKIRPKELVLN